MSLSPRKVFVPTSKQKQAADPAHSVWVSANAGSGKTQVLVQRVIRILLEGIEPASILCITYTKAAAAEMAERLFAQLASWIALSDEDLAVIISNYGGDGRSIGVLTRARKLFTLVLETPGGLKIQTIHAFCERLLHLFPIEAALAPGFGLLDDRAAEELRDRAIAEVVYGDGAEQGIANAFESLNNRLNREQFGELIESYIAGLRKSPIDLNTVSSGSLTQNLKVQLGLLSDDNLSAAQAEFANIDQENYAFHAAKLRTYKPARDHDVAGLLTLISQSEDPSDGLMKLFYTKGLELRKTLLLKQTALSEPDSAFFLEKEANRIDQLLQKLKSLELIDTNANAYTVASAILRKIELEKQRMGKVDFDDLIRRTAQLLATSQARDWVTFKLDPGLSHILLDESQDTGPAQWVIINRLVEEFFAGQGRESDSGPRTLFVVGDDKQSIYSFQGADASAFVAARQNYVDGGRLTKVDLDISYRSTKEILTAVDLVHTPQDGSGQVLRAHHAHRQDAEGLVELWPLEMPDDSPERDFWAKPVDQPPQSSPRRKLARKLALKIKSWLDPQQPRKLSGRNRAVTAGDILILFRSRNAYFRMVMAELRAAGVPVAGADRLSLLQSLIVQDLLALLNWLLLPQDDHALACVLKSPLVPQPLSEEQLFEASYARSGLLFDRLNGPNHDWLSQLQREASSVPPDLLLARILTRSRKNIAARLGPEALEASDAMLDLALDYQREGGASLFGFVQWFQAADTTLKREMDKAGGEVRLMTVHGAKGLEAPIVIIADAAQSPVGNTSKPRVLDLPLGNGATMPLWFPSGIEPLLPRLNEIKDNAKTLQLLESDRLLYVAMTRAEDELYIAGVGAKRGTVSKDSWWPKLIDKLGEPTGDQPLRFGAADVYLPPAAQLMQAEATALPDWLSTSPPPEFEQRSLGLNAALVGSRTYDPLAAKLGRARHRLLQDLGDVPEAERLALAASRASRLGLAPEEAMRLARALSLPELQPFLGEGSRGEVDIRGALQDGTPVNGRLDRLATRPEGIWLLDYKTGTATSPDHLIEMAGYVELLKQAFPGQPITAALFFTQTGKFERLTPDQLTAALRESDASLA